MTLQNWVAHAVGTLFSFGLITNIATGDIVKAEHWRFFARASLAFVVPCIAMGSPSVCHLAATSGASVDADNALDRVVATSSHPHRKRRLMVSAGLLATRVGAPWPDDC